jgi:hypothetical protein
MRSQISVLAMATLLAGCGPSTEVSSNPATVTAPPAPAPMPDPSAVAADDAAMHQWWTARAFEPGSCALHAAPADEIKVLQKQGDEPFVREERNEQGFRTVVEVHATGDSGYHVYYRDKATCDAADREAVLKDCQKLNAQGYAADCDALLNGTSVNGNDYK